jgi:antitoxin YefM
MKRLPLSEAKAHLSEIADEVILTHERLLVTRNGRAALVILSVEDLESIEATMELLADPAAQARVAQAAHLADAVVRDQPARFDREARKTLRAPE